MVTLDERLACAERLAGRCARLVDVGSNHGFLPVHMLQAGLCERALICDISRDALARAQGLVEKTGLDGRAELRVTDGLTGIALAAADVVTICGMGARTIAHILREGAPCPVVMQANVELRLLRRHVEAIGMHVEREDIALAAGRYYVLLRAEPGRRERMSDYEAHMGPALLRDRPPLLLPYLKWRQGVTRRALEGMRLGGNAEKRRQAERDAQDVERALEEVAAGSGRTRAEKEERLR